MPPPPDRGRGAASGRASSSNRPSRALLLPQSQSSSKSRTSSPATAISQPNPNAPNPKPLTTLIPPPLPSTPATPSRPAKAPNYRVQLKNTNLAKPTGPHRTLAANCPYRKNIIRQKEETEQRQKQEQTHSTYAEIAKHAIQQTNKLTTAHTNINKPNAHQTHSPHNRNTHSSIRQNKKFGDILTQSLKLNFNIDTTFPDRDSTAIFNFYFDRTDSRNPKRHKQLYKKNTQ
ncbi:hypothetical protein FHG87_016878 [Trinorchestia longiramus]|nr:hypothetical protein FHG87_016878 [Trinorchestia longiramus]